MSKYGTFSGPYFPAFGLNSPNVVKYGPEKTPYLDTFHAVFCTQFFLETRNIKDKSTLFAKCVAKAVGDEKQQFWDKNIPDLKNG